MLPTRHRSRARKKTTFYVPIKTQNEMHYHTITERGQGRNAPKRDQTRQEGPQDFG